MNGIEYLLIFPGIPLIFIVRMLRRQRSYHRALAQTGLYHAPSVEDVLSEGLFGTFNLDAARFRAADALVDGTRPQISYLKARNNAATRDAILALPISFLAVALASQLLPTLRIALSPVGLLISIVAFLVSARALISAVRFGRKRSYALALAYIVGVMALAAAYVWTASTLLEGS
jgi:hypothetical protein